MCSLMVASSICQAPQWDTPVERPPPVPALRGHPEDLFGRQVHAEREPADRLVAQLPWTGASSSDQKVSSRALSIASSGAVTTIGTTADGDAGVLDRGQHGVGQGQHERVGVVAGRCLSWPSWAGGGGNVMPCGIIRIPAPASRRGDLGEDVPGEPLDLGQDRQQRPERGVGLDPPGRGRQPDPDDHVVVGRG